MCLCYNRPSEDGRRQTRSYSIWIFPTMGGKLRITEVKTKAGLLQIDVKPGGDGNVWKCVSGECGSDNLK